MNTPQSLRVAVPHQVNNKRRGRMTPQELAAQSASYLRDLLATQERTGMDQLVPKRCIQLVMGILGYSAQHVDRKWKRMRGYERFFDDNFPKPIDENAPILWWSLTALLAYKRHKYGI